MADNSKNNTNSNNIGGNHSPIKQLTNKINQVSNILVTVSRNPSVDELASALGLSLVLTKLDKRSVAVFSGQIPPALHFLHPEKTFENNADSLRDFIISLSKDKADRLQVLPDGDYVKVYITPYRTKITPQDFKFSEGDFNVELIIAIGVASRDELDASIARHGKIFHNATTATLNIGQLHDGLGMISWQDNKSGCYAEMCYQLIEALGGQKSLIDEPIATALLTGVVSATDQFRNNFTTPAIMTLSANLMAKGANQQLITSELESAKQSQVEIDHDQPAANVGSMTAQPALQQPVYVNHQPEPAAAAQPVTPVRPTTASQPVPPLPPINPTPAAQPEPNMQIPDLGPLPEFKPQPGANIIDQRLQQDRENIGQQRSDAALQMAQGQLAQAPTPEPMPQPALAPSAPSPMPTMAPLPAPEPESMSPVTPAQPTFTVPASPVSAPAQPTPSLNMPMPPAMPAPAAPQPANTSMPLPPVPPAPTLPDHAAMPPAPAGSPLFPVVDTSEDGDKPADPGQFVIPS